MSGSDSNRPKRLGNWLGDTAAGRVARRARALQAQEQRLWQSLAGLIDGNWRLARLDEEALVLVVESPAHASAVRYRQRQILASVQQDSGVRPRRLRVKVAPTTVKQRPLPRRELSAAAAQHIESAARGMDAPELREALLRLARRAGSR